MSALPQIIPVSDLRQDAASTLKKLEHSQEPIVITQRGRPAAVLMSVEAYERSEEERQILYRLAKGEKEIQVGKSFSLEDVMLEADQILADDPK